MKKTVRLGVSITVFFLASCVTTEPPLVVTPPPQHASTTCEKPFVFFDLGNTVLDTETHNFEKIFYVPGALEYLLKLRQEGFRVGLLVNVPESWGANEIEKLQTLKDFVAKTWSDPRPMDWELFDAGVFFPASNKERKPDPALFKRAARLARAQSCPIVYQGEADDELRVAESVGIRTYRVGQGSRPFFMPIERLR